MPKKGDVHVMPSERGWRVQIEGTGGARSTHTTQAEAAKTARRIARQNSAELLIHGRNGQVRERSTYVRDPRRTKG
jgi:NAD(P)H-nitrite reductase large subunit